MENGHHENGLWVSLMDTDFLMMIHEASGHCRQCHTGLGLIVLDCVRKPAGHEQESSQYSELHLDLCCSSSLQVPD